MKLISAMVDINSNSVKKMTFDAIADIGFSDNCNNDSIAKIKFSDS